VLVVVNGLVRSATAGCSHVNSKSRMGPRVNTYSVVAV
jgi:hypothetical protein